MRTPIATITADIHARRTNPRCRVDNYFEALRGKLEFLRNWREKTGVAALGIPHLDAGDLFHSWKSSPAVEVMLLETLPDNMYSIPGNHEIPFHNLNRLADSSFNVLAASGKIKPVPALEIDAPKMYTAVGLQFAGKKIAMCHGMVWKSRPPMKDMEGIGATELMRARSDFDVIITGHNHQTFTVDNGHQVLINPGSVMRSSIDQIDHQPCFFVLYDDLSFEPVYFPIETDVFAEDVYQKAGEREGRMNAFIERVQNTEGFALSFEDNLMVYCAQNKIGDAVQQEIHKAMEVEL